MNKLAGSKYYVVDKKFKQFMDPFENRYLTHSFKIHKK